MSKSGDQKIKLDVNALQSGSYILKIGFDAGEVTQKVSIRN